MQLNLEYIDGATPWLEWAIAHKAEWTRKATKSTLWHGQQEIKKGIRSEAPGGSQYSARMDAGKRRDIEDVRKGGPDKRRAGTLGNLLNAVGYQYKPEGSPLGWLSRSGVRIGSWHEKSVQEYITPKMRRLFFAAGVRLKKSTIMIKLPRRQTYDPMYAVLDSKLPEYFKQKFLGYLASGGPPEGRRSRRKYTVYG